MIAKKNQIVDEGILKEMPKFGKYGTRRYTFKELVILNYFGCCKKKDRRIVKYKAHKKIISERMDVANIIQSVGYVIALGNVFMEPYHSAARSTTAIGVS